MKGGGMSKKVIKAMGTGVTIVSVFFLIRKLCSFHLKPEQILETGRLGYLMLLSLLFAVHMVIVGVPWKCITEYISGIKIPYPLVAFVVCKANLYKYLPGNVFQYVGRNEIAVRQNISHGKVALSTFGDILMNLVSVALLSIMLCRGGIRDIWLYYNLQQRLWVLCFGGGILILLAVIAGIIGIQIRRKKGYRRKLWFGKKVVREIVPRGMFCMAYYFFLGIYTGIMFYFIVSVVLGENVLVSQVPLLMGGYLFGWAVGFVIPGAPGGIGVREAVTVVILSASFNQKIILEAILLYRFVNVLGDIGGFLMADIIYTFSAKTQ